ncbi:MAG: hypothetical protein GX270_10290 [Clostridiaceae bacterium]|jgi:hypothetical protein|nr:hypothetical protein [Clostridiaceae bacterium]
MCSKCHDQKISFNDFLKSIKGTKSKLEKESIEETHYNCSECGKEYDLDLKKSGIVIIVLVFLIYYAVAYSLAIKCDRFLKLILANLSILPNLFWQYVIALIEFCFFVTVINLGFIRIYRYLCWKLSVVKVENTSGTSKSTNQ